MLRYLASQKRFDDAYVLAGQSLRYAPQDANLLVNRGILAQQSGHFQEAAASWTKRVYRLYSAQPLAHLYLTANLREGTEVGSGDSVHMVFVEQIAKAGTKTETIFTPQSAIAVVLKLAQYREKARCPELERNSPTNWL